MMRIRQVNVRVENYAEATFELIKYFMFSMARANARFSGAGWSYPTPMAQT